MTTGYTTTDLFCGAGGSGIGAAAAGLQLVMAANHSPIAIDTHSTNFPDTEHDCFVAGTLVLTATGQRPIEDVAPGELVLTHRGRWRPVVRKFTKRDRTVRARSTLHAAGTQVTPNHEYWTRTSTLRVAGSDYKREYGAPSWRSIGETRVDRVRRAGHSRDMVAFPAVFGELPWQDPEGLLDDPCESWWLIGRWLGDGSSGQRNGDVTIVCGHHEAAHLRARIPAGWRGREVRTGHQFYDYDRKLAAWLREHFGAGAAGKGLPGWVLTMPADRRRALLDGYVSADGSSARGTTRISTVSRCLAIGVRSLAHSFGYAAGLNLSDRGGPCVIEGRTVQRRAVWTVNWQDKPTRQSTMLDDLHRWAYVQDVGELCDETDVFTMEVAEDHSYVADGVVVKNCADISQVDPRRYARTDFLWASPECTHHSGAKGNQRARQQDLFTQPDPTAERSRATMWDVPRFAEHHRYDIVLVENVVEIAEWEMWPAWLHAMRCLGYRHRVVSLNSMHAPAELAPRAPQSRDRIYVAFWRQGVPEPDLDPRPSAYCATCDTGVEAVQWWKPNRCVGRYRQQYLYRCPGCHGVVEPYALPAAVAIDWTSPGQRIGDRARPLKPATIARIEAGLERYAHAPQLVPLDSRGGKRVIPTTEPMRTQTTRHETALVVPYYGTGVARTAAEPLPTQPTHDRFGVAFIAELRGGGSTCRPVTAPLSTVTASGTHHMLVRNNGTRPSGDGMMCTPATEPLRTLTTAGHQSLVGWPHEAPAVEDCTFRMLQVPEISAAMAFTPAYVLKGTKRQQVMQLGNAVTPPASEWLYRRCVATLGG